VKTCCPSCQTIFRVSPEQLQLRAGKVRCGKCRAVFNAIDRLLDENDKLRVSGPRSGDGSVPTALAPDRKAGQKAVPAVRLALALDSRLAQETPALLSASGAAPQPASSRQAVTAHPEVAGDDPLSPVSPKASAAGDGRWLEEVQNEPPLAGERTLFRPFAAVAAFLVVILVSQLVFHLRSDIAIAAPSLRPALEALSSALASEMPLPRQAALVSIETSDLQVDAGANKLLALQATLRNRAAYAQAYPALELTLTDTHDKAIARRVLMPDDYLPAPQVEDKSFPANAYVDLRLWLETGDLAAAGYRLYVFYP
jgi:predicted Zn finger-like uncharacterized protein